MKLRYIPSCRDEAKNQDDSLPTSPTLSLGPICRICHEGDYRDELVAPCHCTGSMAVVHQTCLERWLSSANSDACEICKYKFAVFRQPMPITQWFLRPSSPEDCRNLVGDLLCFILLTPLAAVSSYLCFTGAKSYSAWNVKWEASGLICLSLMLIAIYFTWCTITVRYHVHNWRRWRSTHQNVHLLQLRLLSESDQIDLNNENNNDRLISQPLEPPSNASGASYEDDSGRHLTSIVSLSESIHLGSAVVVELATYPSATRALAFSAPGSSIKSGSIGETNSDFSASTACASTVYQNQCLQPLLSNDAAEEHELVNETKF